MSASWYWARASRRRVARGGALLALLVAVGAGGAMGAAAGARRTATSLERLGAVSNVPDAFVFARDAATFERLTAGPDVRAASGYVQLGLQPAHVPCTDDPSAYYQVLVPAAGEPFATPRPRVIRGRMADPASPSEAVVSEQHARRLGIDVGDTISYRPFDVGGEDDDEVLGCLDETVGEVTVVGVVRELLEIGAGDEPTSAATYLTPAFVEANPDAPEITFAGIAGFVDLSTPAQVEAFIERANPGAGQEGEEPESGAVRIPPSSPLKPAVDALAVGLWALAGVVALATAVALGVAVLRQTGSAAPDLRVLAALGLTRRQVAATAAVPVVLAVTAGLPLAVLVAGALSRVHLVGVAAVVEPDPGFALDPFVLLTGTAATAVIGGIAAALAGWRQAVAAGRPAAGAGRRRPGIVSGLLRRRSAPWAALGADYALGPATPTGTALPARSSVVAVGAATMGMLAVLVFGIGVGRANQDSSVYGWGDWYGFASPAEGEDGDPAEIVLADPDVATVANVSARFKLSIDGQTASGLVVEQRRGRTGPTVVDGRLPSGPDEIALGSDTAEQLGAGLGSTVAVEGPAGPDRFDVVGIAALPGIDSDALASGFVADRVAMDRLGWPEGCNDEAECINTVALTWRDGADIERATERLLQAGVEVEPAAPGREVALIGEADQVPGFGAAGMALVAAVSMAHTLTVTVSRRRRELAVARAIGFDRRQTAGVVVTQGLVLALAGGVLGGVLGVAAGRAAWRGAARAIGIGPALPSVAGMAVAVVGVVVLLALVLSAMPARRAARLSPAVGLRTEQ